MWCYLQWYSFCLARNISYSLYYCLEYAASLVQAFQQLLDNQRAASCFCISYYTSTTNHYAAGAASGANASISLPSGYPNALTGAYLYRGVLTHQPNEWAVIYAASSYLFIRAQESSNKLSTAPMLCYQLYTYSQWCYSRLFVAPLLGAYLQATRAASCFCISYYNKKSAQHSSI